MDTKLRDAALAASNPLTLQVSFIVPSLTNPRKAFDKVGLQELAASIKTHGVLQPVMVRPWPATRKAPKDFPDAAAAGFELVVGERRWRAAQLAGLEAIPATVCELTDAEVVEVQVVENLQREDLHPLEEAEGYERLLKLGADASTRPGGALDVATLAAQVGKSKAYVYARLKLCALVPAARKVFLDGWLNAATALLVARIPVPELQVKAAKEIVAGSDYRDGSPMSVQVAKQHVQEHYMLRLGEAPWPVADALLVPAAGACTTCPKRTGNQRDLFGDVESADVCTDPPCFAGKKKAWEGKLRAEAEASGREVIAGKEAKAIKPREYSEELKGYVDLSARCYEDPKHRTYQALLGKHAATAPLLEDPHTKELRTVMPVADVTKALKEKGYTWAGTRRTPSTSSTSIGADQRKREARAKLEREVRRRVHEAVREKVTGSLSREDMALVAGAFYADIWDGNRKRVMALWGWEHKGGSVNTGKAHVAQMKEAELRRLLVDLALVKETHVWTWDSSSSRPTQLLEAAKRHGVDAAAIRREVETAAKAKAAARVKGAKKPSPQDGNAKKAKRKT
jgi:ParB/RepB/Spo0J family partition protein